MRKRTPKAKPADRPKPLTAGRRVLFVFMALALAPLLAFGLLEGGLRLAGYGYDTAFFKKARIDGRDFFVNNDKFVLRFFPPQLARLPGPVRMTAEKGADTCRIFILGESAALGDPSPPYAASRYLQTMLSTRFPGMKFEVVNVSITAINSHVIVPIARECAEHEGDFWIVYMGNNEMVGPFGAATVFGAQAPPVWTVRLSIALQKTRVGQLLMNTVRALRSSSAKSASWRGMEMFLGNQLPPNDPRKERVYRNFQQNLRDILQAGLDSGARVILNTVAVNQRDCSPFGSMPGANAKLADNAGKQWGVEEQKIAAELQHEGDYQRAAADFEKAAEADPWNAALQYNCAQCLEQITNFTAAREHYQRACDCDALPFRTDSRLNDIIRQTGREMAATNLLMFDAATSLAAGNPDGVCGDETFLEHVHFNFDGNYRLGKAWAEMIAPFVQPRTPASKWTIHPLPSQTECEKQLGLTDWNRLVTMNEMLRRRRQAPLNGQSNNAVELESLSREFNALMQKAKNAPIAEDRALYLDDIQKNPDDYFLLFNYADFLEATANWLEGAAAWRQAGSLLPDNYLCYFQQGRMLERAGHLDEAEANFLQAVTLYPRMTTAWFELSNIHASEGKYEKAQQECERAIALEPEQPSFYVCLGKLLTRMNRPADALQELRKAVEISPNYVDGHLALGKALAQAGRADEAAGEFREVLRLDPNNQTAHQALDNPFR